MMATADGPGALLVVHVTILAIARGLDGEPVSEADWEAVRKLLVRLADLLESPDTATLDPLGLEWRDWKHPGALH